MTSIPTSEHAEFHATTWRAIISETKDFLWIFSCISEMGIKIRTFGKKKMSLRAYLFPELLTPKEVVT